MGLFSGGLIVGSFFVHWILGLIFGWAYFRVGLLSGNYGIYPWFKLNKFDPFLGQFRIKSNKIQILTPKIRILTKNIKILALKIKVLTCKNSNYNTNFEEEEKRRHDLHKPFLVQTTL